MNDLAPSAPDTGSSVDLTPNTAPNNPSSFKPDAPEPKPEAPKPMSAREALEKAAQDVKITEPAKAAPEVKKPAAELKPQTETKAAPARAENGKFAPTQEPLKSSDSTSEAKGTGQAGDDNRPSEGREHEAPPARFLPPAKEAWGSTPDPVKAEVHRAIQNMERGMDEYKESHEFRKELKPFEEMAKASGVTVKQALENYTAIDRLLKSNPEQGLEKVFKAAGIDPIAYAKHILGQQQQLAANPGMAQTQQLERQVQALTQQITQLTQGQQQEKQEVAKTQQISEIERTVINPFRESLGDQDRYEELQEDIEFFLNSGKVPFNLSAQRRLEAAYDMAVRINPAPYSAPQKTQRPLNPAGEKSIKGAPAGGTDPKTDKGKLSPRDAIRAAAAELGVQM